MAQLQLKSGMLDVVNKTPNFIILERKQLGSEKIDSLKIRCIFQEVDKVNKNGRVYPKKAIEKEINRLRPKIENRELLGELDHPMENDLERIQYIKLSEVSHLILKLEIDNDYVYGEFETLNTPKGVILRNLIEHGITLGISLRQIGSVSEKFLNGKNIQYVNQDDFELITYDVVSEPSFQSQKFILTEQYKEILDGVTLDKIERFVYERLYYHMKKHLKGE